MPPGPIEWEAWREAVQARDVLLFWIAGGVGIAWFVFDSYVNRLERTIKGCPTCRARINA